MQSIYHYDQVLQNKIGIFARLHMAAASKAVANEFQADMPRWTLQLPSDLTRIAAHPSPEWLL
jgi:hypothetical protein